MQKQVSPVARAQLITYLALLVAGAAAALGFGLQGLWVDMLVSLAMTVLALFAEARLRRRPLAGITFAAFSLLGVVGLLRGLPGLAGLVIFGAALVAWDLHHFVRRLQQVDRVEAPGELVRAHVQRLFVVVGLGLVAGGLALYVRIDFGLTGIALLSLVLVFSLSRVVRHLRRDSD